MKVYLIFNKRLLIAVLLGLLLTVLIVGRFSSVTVKNRNADTHKKRVDFINNLGYKIDENFVSKKEITIPYSFIGVYKKYNEIQKRASYDLENFKGKNAILYSYNLCGGENNTKQINLLVYNGVIIGGNIHNTASNSEFLPLIRIREN